MRRFILGLSVVALVATVASSAGMAAKKVPPPVTASPASLKFTVPSGFIQFKSVTMTMTVPDGRTTNLQSVVVDSSLSPVSVDWGSCANYFNLYLPNSPTCSVNVSFGGLTKGRYAGQIKFYWYSFDDTPTILKVSGRISG